MFVGVSIERFQRLKMFCKVAARKVIQSNGLQDYNLVVPVDANGPKPLA